MTQKSTALLMDNTPDLLDASLHIEERFRAIVRQYSDNDIENDSDAEAQSAA